MNIRMSTKGKRPLRSLTPSDKIHAIQRIHDGESKASVARDIGVPESTLRGWCKNEDKLRFMSRQSDKMSADSLAEKLGGASGLLGGPPEKRQKLDGSLPLNFSNKLKYDEMVYKRSPLNGLDYSTNKSLTELSFNGLPPEYMAFSGAVKNKVFGADISRQADPAIAAISPLTSLTNLSGLTGLAQSPLAISFNELTSNLNLLAQLNPGLAAMSGFNGLAATASTLRNIKPKAQPPQIHSPRSESGDRQQGLSVKNWAKQKSPTPSTSNDINYGLNLSQNEVNINNKMKCPSPSLAPSLGNTIPSIPEDPLLYWLKSQQAMLGLNHLYQAQPAALGASSPPIRSSTPQQSAQHHPHTPPIASTPLTPSSTPTVSLDDKNSAWFNWCKALGASLNSLAPAATVAALHGAPIQQPATSTTNTNTTKDTTAATTSLDTQKPHLENILFTHLTKETTTPTVQSPSSVDNAQNNDAGSVTDSAGKPEDLSSKSTRASPAPSSLPTPANSTASSPNPDQYLRVASSKQSPSDHSLTADAMSTGCDQNAEDGVTSMSECKDVLDNLLYKINNNPNVSLSNAGTPNSVEGVDGAGSESDGSYNSDHHDNHDAHHHSNDATDTNDNHNVSHNNNNNHSNKTDEEERVKCADLQNDEDDTEAIKHGEKFLKWLENCSNPRVTATQLMQFRFLISAIKSGCDPKDHIKEYDNTTNADAVEVAEDNSEEGNRAGSKVRRRK